MEKIRISHEDWIKECLSREKDPMSVKFKCPVCNNSANAYDYLNAGAPETAVGFSCIGRYLKNKKSAIFSIKKGESGPCDYAGGGLFRMNPIIVVFEDGTEGEFFDFDKNPLTENPPSNDHH